MTKKEKFRQAVLARAGNICEICDKGGELNVHHIEGRKKPRVRTGAWPAEIADDYPHIILNGIALCLGAHKWVGDALKHSRPLLWAWLGYKYGRHIYKGKTVAEYLAGPGPWEEYL